MANRMVTTIVSPQPQNLIIGGYTDPTVTLQGTAKLACNYVFGL